MVRRCGLGLVVLIMSLGRGFGRGLRRLRHQQGHPDSELVGVTELGSVGVKDVGPASRRAEFTLGNRGEGVAAAYCDDAPAPVGDPLIQIRNSESPANLQPVGATSQHRGVRRRDLAPVWAISVVPLGQAPEIIACLHYVVAASVLDPLRPGCRRGRGWRCDLSRLDDRCHWLGRSRCGLGLAI